MGGYRRKIVEAALHSVAAFHKKYDMGSENLTFGASDKILFGDKRAVEAVLKRAVCPLFDKRDHKKPRKRHRRKEHVVLEVNHISSNGWQTRASCEES